jgi:hypothetical protein
MATELKATIRVDVAGSGTLAATHKIDAEAYDRIDVALPAKTNGDTVKVVDVQPGDAGQVQLLLITASQYQPALTYTVDARPPVELDAPQLLVGKGAVGLLGGAVNAIEFTNANAQDIKVQILVGRDATPPEPPSEE